MPQWDSRWFVSILNVSKAFPPTRTLRSAAGNFVCNGVQSIDQSPAVIDGDLDCPSDSRLQRTQRECYYELMNREHCPAQEEQTRQHPGPCGLEGAVDVCSSDPCEDRNHDSASHDAERGRRIPPRPRRGFSAGERWRDLGLPGCSPDKTETNSAETQDRTERSAHGEPLHRHEITEENQPRVVSHGRVARGPEQVHTDRRAPTTPRKQARKAEGGHC